MDKMVYIRSKFCDMLIVLLENHTLQFQFIWFFRWRGNEKNGTQGRIFSSSFNNRLEKNPIISALKRSLKWSHYRLQQSHALIQSHVCASSLRIKNEKSASDITRVSI